MAKPTDSWSGKSKKVNGGVIRIGGGGFEGGNDILSVGGNPDPRDDINNMFREIGFRDVEGMSGTDTAVLGAYGIALNRLEREYGALSILGDIPVLGANTASTIAAVRYDRNGGKANALILSRNLMGNISKLVSSQRGMEESGFKMPTDGSLLSDARYTVTHEYGHLLHSALTQKTGKTEYQLAREFKEFAERRYNATNEDVSRYGHTNSAEFFAESFANANSGNPNRIGRAMREWLRQFK